jgi:hypothetical protein
MSKKSNKNKQNKAIAKTDEVEKDLIADEKPADKSVEKAVEPEGTKDEFELSVPEDRKRLVVEGVGYLLLSLVLLFAILGCWVAANVTGNVVLLIVILIIGAAVWFVCKAMGRRFNRFATKVNVVDFGQREVYIYQKSEPKKAIVVSYKDIKNYKLIRQGNSLRLLLAGDWVEHPSGFHLVDINRPFMKDTIDELQKQIVAVMKEHHVNERK